MPFQFCCPQGHVLQGDESQVGQLFHCPMCGSNFLVPPPEMGPAAAGGYFQGAGNWPGTNAPAPTFPAQGGMPGMLPPQAMPQMPGSQMPSSQFPSGPMPVSPMPAAPYPLPPQPFAYGPAVVNPAAAPVERRSNRRKRRPRAKRTNRYLIWASIPARNTCFRLSSAVKAPRRPLPFSPGGVPAPSFSAPSSAAPSAPAPSFFRPTLPAPPYSDDSPPATEFPAPPMPAATFRARCRRPGLLAVGPERRRRSGLLAVHAGSGGRFSRFRGSPKILHIRCPAGHLVTASSDLLGKAGRCQACKATFEIRYEDSVEFKRRKAKLLHHQEVASGRPWVAWAFLGAFLVFVALIAVLLAVANRGP